MSVQAYVPSGLCPAPHEWFVIVTATWKSGFVVGSVFHVGESEESCRFFLHKMAKRKEGLAILPPNERIKEALEWLGKPSTLRMDIMAPRKPPQEKDQNHEDPGHPE